MTRRPCCRRRCEGAGHRRGPAPDGPTRGRRPLGGVPAKLRAPPPPPSSCRGGGWLLVLARGRSRPSRHDVALPAGAMVQPVLDRCQRSTSDNAGSVVRRCRDGRDGAQPCLSRRLAAVGRDRCRRLGSLHSSHRRRRRDPRAADSRPEVGPSTDRGSSRGGKMFSIPPGCDRDPTVGVESECLTLRCRSGIPNRIPESVVIATGLGIRLGIRLAQVPNPTLRGPAPRAPPR